MASSITSRAGGAYMPPHKLREAAAAVASSSGAAPSSASEAAQRSSWEALRKSINGLINKVCIGNLPSLLPHLFRENLVRGRGLLVRSLLKSCLSSPAFTPLYMALLAVVNSKLPELGLLLLHRLVVSTRRALARNNALLASAYLNCMAHCVNQRVLGEVTVLQVITGLLESPTEDGLQLCVDLIRSCGAHLTTSTPGGVTAIFDRLRVILSEGNLNPRTAYAIEALFQVRRLKFAAYPAIEPELDLVEAEDQITHEVEWDDDNLNPEHQLDVFRLDDAFEVHEAAWRGISAEILGDDQPEPQQEEEAVQVAPPPPAAVQVGGGSILDLSETDVVNLKRSIYLTIQSSLDFEEAAHKLLKLSLPRGSEPELAGMLVDCASQERTYMRYFGLLAQRLCMVSDAQAGAMEEAFKSQYASIHRLETNKLRNVAKFFAHLLYADAIPWTVLSVVRLNEEETSSSSRIFIKILVQEMSEYMGLAALRDRLADPVMAPYFAGLMPMDVPRNTRFAINFFTSIGLGALTDDMRLALAAAPKASAALAAVAAAAAAAPAPAAAVAAPPPQQQKGEEEPSRRTRRRRRSPSVSSYSSYSSSGSYSGSGSGSYSSSDDSRPRRRHASHARRHSRSPDRRSKRPRMAEDARDRSPPPSAAAAVTAGARDDHPRRQARDDAVRDDRSRRGALPPRADDRARRDDDRDHADDRARDAARTRPSQDARVAAAREEEDDLMADERKHARGAAAAPHDVGQQVKERDAPRDRDPDAPRERRDAERLPRQNDAPRESAATRHQYDAPRDNAALRDRSRSPVRGRDAPRPVRARDSDRFRDDDVDREPAPRAKERDFDDRRGRDRYDRYRPDRRY